MTVTLIAAVARNGVIGADGGIPWHLPEDFAHFKATTLGHTLVMGRATYDSIGRPLPGPHHDRAHPRPRLARRRACRPRRRIEEALALAEGDVYVAGGAAVYAAALPYADEQVISEVDLEPEGDTYYPAFDRSEWQEVGREPHDGFTVVRWRRAVGRRGLDTLNP